MSYLVWIKRTALAAKSGLKYLLYAILLLCIVLTGGIIWLISTETGFHTIIHQAQRWLPGQLTVKTAQGRLLSQISLEQFAYRYRETNIKLDAFQWTWEAKALLRATLHVEKLHINGLKVHLPAPQKDKDKPQKQKHTLPDIHLPIQVVLDDIAIHEVNIQSGQAKPIVIDSLTLRSTTTDILSISSLQVKSPLLNADLTGQLGLRAPHTTQLNLTWSAALSPTLKAAGHGKIAGDIQRLTVIHELSQPTTVQLNSSISHVLDDPDINATVNWHALSWPLTQQPMIKSQMGQLRLTGKATDYRLRLQTRLAGEKIPQGDYTITAQGNQQTLTIENLRAELLEGWVEAVGQVRWQPQLAAHVDLEAHQITLQSLWRPWPELLRLEGQLKANLKDKTFKIEQLDLRLPKTATQLMLKAEGTLAGKMPHIQTADLTWRNLQWPLLGKITQVNSAQGRFHLQGDATHYKANLTGQLAGAKIPQTHLALKGEGNQQQFIIDTLHTQLLKGQVDATGAVRWQPQLEAQLALQADQLSFKEIWGKWPDNLSLTGDLAAKLEGQQFEIDQCQVQLPETATQLSLQGKGTLAGEQSQLDAQLAWQNLQWPLQGPTQQVHSRQGQLTVQGKPHAYQVQLNTDITGKDIPAGHWQFAGKGNQQQLQLDRLTGQILAGQLNLTGNVNWQPQVQWQLALQGQAIDPAQQWPAWPGQLTFELDNTGQLQKGVLETQINLKQLHGKLRNYPIELHSQLAIKDKNYHIKALELTSGPTHFTAQGNITHHLDLTWAMQAPELAALWPETQGHLVGEGQLRGPLKSPHIIASLQGKTLAFKDMQLAGLKADVDVDLQEELHLAITADQFQQKNNKIKQISLKGQGRMANHQLTADINLPQDHLTLQLQGNLQLPRWQGVVQQWAVTTQAFGNWQLEQIAGLSLAPENVRLETACLTQHQQKAQVCLQLDWQKAAESAAELRLTAIPLGIARPFLPPDLDISGQLNGHLAAQLHANGTLSANNLLTVSPGQLKTRVAEEPHTFAHQGGQAALQITEQGLQANLDLKLLEQSHITGQLALPRLTHLPLPSEQPLQGQVQATFADLSILPTFVPQAENTQGKVNIAAQFEGTLAQPKIQGQLKVVEAATDLPELGLALRHLNVALHSSEGDTVHLKASVDSGEGQLQVQGQAKLLPVTHWQADMTIKGDQFEVVNTPTAWALASPDITLHMQPARLDARGTLLIPQAAITPPEVENSAVAVSEDVIIIRPQQPTPSPETVEKKWGISSEVRLILGDDVSFKGAGFKSRLGGNLLASNKPHKVTVGNGELYILDGTYKAYGQNLSIDKGRVIFTGGPIDNPGLDIQAVRHIRRSGEQDVTAGVRIQGTAKSPKISLFSEPTFDQSNTLSYIILGKPASQATEGEGNILLGAAASMGIDEGDSLTKKIGQQFGFDEAGISSEGSVEETALVVGKYLSPRLYISYGVGLFDGSTVLRMRYELTKRLMLETETGTQSGVDLRYTLER